MALNFRNINFLKAFVRNLSNIEENSRQAASKLADEMESIIRNRTSQGRYLSGVWRSKGYSNSPIKAYKLGRAVVSGTGMGNKQMTIDGKSIQRDDWYWGDWDREDHGVTNLGGRGGFGESSSPRPTPVFIPGYAGWRRKYNSRSLTVNMRFSRKMSMMDNFSVEMWRGRGSNQYGSNWRFSFEVTGAENVKEAKYTNMFRKWRGITKRELDQAIKSSGASLSSMLFYGG